MQVEPDRDSVASSIARRTTRNGHWRRAQITRTNVAFSSRELKKKEDTVKLTSVRRPVFAKGWRKPNDPFFASQRRFFSPDRHRLRVRP